MKLPDKPSELIRLALKDLEECEKDPNYEIDMNIWHKPEKSQCYVCLAGAVMAKTYKVAQTRDLAPGDLSDVIGFYEMCKLWALDSFRYGQINHGLLLLRMGYDNLYICVKDVPDYDKDNPTPFKLAMLKIADYLQGQNL